MTLIDNSNLIDNTPHKGESRETAVPFPQYAKTTNPTLLEAFQKHREDVEQEFIKRGLEILAEATGNPDLKRLFQNGAPNGRRHITGVAYNDIDESMKSKWKQPKNGISQPKKMHPMYKQLSKLTYEAPNFAFAPPEFFARPYLFRTQMFVQGDALWFGASHPTPTDSHDYWPDLSPWEEVRGSEFMRAMEDYNEAQKIKRLL